MKYKINHFLLYDATEGSLKLENNEKSNSRLTITANSLLFFMIQNPGVISRDDVMKRIWDDNGLASSNSNLNQYISILRKTFRYYGIENIIVTVPPGRLEINPSLTIEKIKKSSLDLTIESHSIEEIPNNIPSKIRSLLSLKKRSRHGYYWGYAGILIFLFSFFLLGIAWENSTRLTPLTLTSITKKNIDLFSTDVLINPKVREDHLKNFIAVKEKKKIKHNKDEKFIFFYSDKLQSNGLGRTFLAHCVKQGNNPFNYCDNYFYYSWK